MSGRGGQGEQTDTEEEPQSVGLSVFLGLEQDEAGGWRCEFDERHTGGQASVRRLDRVRRDRMTRVKRREPLVQIHSDPTRAHDIHLHYFYYFDTATDLYLRARETKKTNWEKKLRLTVDKSICNLHRRRR